MDLCRFRAYPSTKDEIIPDPETFSLKKTSNGTMNTGATKCIFFQWVIPALAFALLTAPSLAEGYAYYPFYRPVDSLPATGAALGPWPWNFNFGGGPTTVVGGASQQINNGYNFNVGTGYNFTPRLGLTLEFLDAGLGATDAALQQNGAIDGTAHMWSVTLEPVWRFRIGGPVGAYIIGGGGYYERDMRFTEPVEVFVPTYHGGFYARGLEDVYQHDGAGGVNVGAGITYNLGWGTKLYVEARYHYVFTAGGNTEIIPVTIGFRW